MNSHIYACTNQFYYYLKTSGIYSSTANPNVEVTAGTTMNDYTKFHDRLLGDMTYADVPLQSRLNTAETRSANLDTERRLLVTTTTLILPSHTLQFYYYSSL